MNPDSAMIISKMNDGERPNVELHGNYKAQLYCVATMIDEISKGLGADFMDVIHGIVTMQKVGYEPFRNSSNKSNSAMACKALYDSRRMNGLCVRCGREAVEGKSMCEEHLKKGREVKKL